MPAADPTAPGITRVAAAGDSNVLWLSERGTPPLQSIKALALVGTPAASGPSANQGQTISLKGGALNPGVASFTGYNGTDVTATLTSIKPGKKGKAVVPPLAITGDVTVIPTGGEETAPLRLQIVPTLSSLSSNLVQAGDNLTITGTGFDPGLRVVVPGVATPVVPSALDNLTASITIPAGVQKGKLKVTTAGGTSNTLKIKLAAATKANHSLALDPTTGYILATDDNTNTLDAIDPATGRIVHSVPVVEDPLYVLGVNEQGKAFVVNADGESTVVDVASWTAESVSSTSFDIQSRGARLDVDRGTLAAVDESWTVDVGAGAEWFDATKDGRFAVVVLGDAGILRVVDLETHAVVNEHRFDGPIEGIVICLDGRAYTIDRKTGVLLSIPVE